MVVRALRAFLAVHRRGTVVAAAEEVHLSAAAVSVQLKLLEERLGADLFVRTKRSLGLTSTGQRLVPLAEKMLAVYDEMQALSDPGAVDGKITLGVINSALTGVFPAIMGKLKAENARLEIKIVAGASPLLASQVEAGVLDAAVVKEPPRQLASSLLVHPLYGETYALILPKDMPYINLATSLESASYIALDRSTWTGHDIDAFLAHKGISVHPAMELNTHDAILAAIRHGLGVSILPVSRYGSAAQDTALQLIALPGFQRAVCLVERKVHPQSHLTRKILSAFAALEAGRPRPRGHQPSTKAF